MATESGNVGGGKKKASRKRRGRGEGAIFQREEDNLWVGTVSLGYHGDGRRNRQTVYGNSKREVAEEMDRLRAQARAGTVPDKVRFTVGQMLGRWLEATRSRTAPRTFEERERVINTHLIPRVGSAQLAKLNALHVEGLYADMARDRVGPVAARHAADTLSAALNHAVRLRLIATNPADAVPSPAVPKSEMLFLDANQVKLVLAEAARWPCGPLVTLALGSGCRQGELLGLHWPELDLDAGTLRVKQALTHTKAGGYQLKEPKSAAGRRVVRLPQFAIDAMLDHRSRRLKAGLIGSPVFCTASGGWTNKRNVLRSLRAVIDRINDPAPRTGGRPRADAPPPRPRERLGLVPDGLRFHDLRHTVASLLLSSGQSLRAVSAMLGHSNPAMTLRVYAHVMPTDSEQLSIGLQKLVG